MVSFQIIPATYPTRTLTTNINITTNVNQLEIEALFENIEVTEGNYAQDFPRKGTDENETINETANNSLSAFFFTKTENRQRNRSGDLN